MKYTPEQLRMWAQFMDDTSDFPPDDITAQFSDVFRAHADALDERGELIEALKLIVELDKDAHPGLSTWHDARALLARIGE